MFRLTCLLLAVLPAITGFATPAAEGEAVSISAARRLFETRGKSAEAQQAFERIAAAEPGNPEALNYLAQLALRRDDAAKAVAYAEQAAAIAPNHAGIQHTLGDAHGRSAQKASLFSQLGFAKKCLAAYQRAVELAPESVPFRFSLFNYYRQAPAIAGGGREKAAQEAAAIQRLDALEGHRAFAALYLSNQQYDRALGEFDAILQARPDDYGTHYQIGRLAATTGQFADRGLAALHRCLELPPGRGDPTHANTQWRIGQILEMRRDFSGARGAYEAALKLDPGFNSAADSLKKLP